MSHISVDEESGKVGELCASVCPNKLITTGEQLSSNGYHPAMIHRERKGGCAGRTLSARMWPDVAITVRR